MTHERGGIVAHDHLEHTGRLVVQAQGLEHDAEHINDGRVLGGKDRGERGSG